MSVMLRLRQYHAVLGLLVVLAYVSGEWGIVHAWLGYAVAAIILVRLIWATTGVRQLGLMRFYPVFKGLRLNTALTHPAISRALLLGIAISLIGTTATGVMMDRGRTLGIAASTVVPPALADSDRGQGERRNRPDKGSLDDIHEALANLLILIVICHVTYLTLFKFPLARFMLFLDRPAEDERGTISNPG
jgi:3-ketosteroid 9alpha-monooxygenase subunit B